MNVHCARRLTDMFRQCAVGLTGQNIARRMIVDDSHLRRPLKQCLTQNSPHVGIRPVDAAGAYPYLIYHFCRLIQKQHPKLFLLQIAHQRVEKIVYVFRTFDLTPHFRFLQLPPLPSSRAAITVMLLAGPMPLKRE